MDVHRTDGRPDWAGSASASVEGSGQVFGLPPQFCGLLAGAVAEDQRSWRHALLGQARPAGSALTCR